MSGKHPGLRTKLIVLFGYLPQRRAGDVFVLGHPRSGTTWLRTMMTNIFVPEANSDPDVFNERIPGVSLRNLVKISKLPSPRFLSSHTSFIPGLPKAIYVVRDGRDALVSFYRYTTMRKRRMGVGTKRTDLEFEEFFERYYRGEYRSIWHHHVESWLKTGKRVMGDRLLVVKYEKIKADPLAELTRIMDFTDQRFSVSEIETGVEKASLDTVRRIEKTRWKEKGLGEPDKNSSFYGRGKSGNWNEYFTDDIMRRFVDRSREALELAEYSLEFQ